MTAYLVMFDTDFTMSYSWSPIALNGVSVYLSAYLEVVS